MSQSWKPPDDASDPRRSPTPHTTRRTANMTPTARLAGLYALLLLVGYLAGVLHHQCSGDGTSPISRWAAMTFHGQHPAGSEKSFVGLHGHSISAEDKASGPAAAPVAAPPTNMSLRFPVCNGFANQRLAVVYGMLLAKELRRAAVLPVLIDNGLQRSDASVLASSENQVPFGDMYDVSYFREKMLQAGVHVMLPEEAPPLISYTPVNLGVFSGNKKIESLDTMYGDVRHLAVDCPLFSLQSWEIRELDAEFVWAVLAAMRPSAQAADVVERVSRAIVQIAAQKEGRGQQGIRGRSKLATYAAATAAVSHAEAPAFNWIHLRIENDWLEHCKRWEAIPDGIIRDNCYRYTEEVDTQLQLFGMRTDLPLYVASYWEDVDPERRDRVLSRLVAAGYTLVSSTDVAAAASEGLGEELAARGREYRAMIEYFVGMSSKRFIGNSVSTFAALGLLERRRRGQWAAYYNGGNIPLASVMPLLHRLPWVFTYNSWSPTYDYLLKGAVRSAAATRSLQPYCLFTGTTSSTIYAWLVEHNVTMITHEPTWRNQLLAMAEKKARDNVHHSHLFKTPDTLVSTFQRVDLPVMPVMDQYTYVLYTDADVYFRKPVALDDFGLPLPKTVALSYEMDNMFPYNAGVMLCNLPAMRQNYEPFIRMMLDNDNGLYYPNYGPADQGIINKFYEKDLRARMLSQQFNAKPYNPFDPNAFIVHFHGPKPHELAAYLKEGTCEFKGLCERCFLNGLCMYLPEWATFETDALVSVRLIDACALLNNPVMQRLRSAAGGVRRHLQQALA